MQQRRASVRSLGTAVSLVVLLSCVVQVHAGLAATRRALTAAEQSRKWQDWSRNEIKAMGWHAYDDEPLTEAVENRRWDQNDPNGTRLGSCVTYSFINAAVALDIAGNNTAPMPGGFGGEVVTAAATWAAAADVHITGEADAGMAHDAAGAVAGNIRVGAENIDGALGVLAHAFYPPVNGLTRAGDLHFDNTEAWVLAGAAPGPPFDVQTVALHELGHSLGLTHGGTVAGDVMFGAYTGVKRALAAGDIGFITAIYGAAGHVANCTGPRNPATGAIVPVPGMSTAGMLVLAQLLLIAGIWSFRKFRMAERA